MGFGPDAVGIAYDRTVLKTGKLTWGYMDKILSNWHGKGLHSSQEIMEKDGKPDRGAALNAHKDSKQKFGSPNHEEIERMQRVLEKIKED